MRYFTGAGGGSSARTPQVLADTLGSKDRIEVILGMCQGPIKGLTNGLKSFYFGTTAFQNLDGSYNVPLFSIDVYQGFTPGSPIVPVLGGFEDFRSIYQSLPAGVARTINTVTGPLNQIVVRLNFATLFQAGVDVTLAGLPGVGNILSTFLPNTAQILVQYKSVGAADSTYVNPFNGPVQIVGKTNNGEVHEIRFPTAGGGPFTVYIELLTPENPPTTNCECLLEGIYEVAGGVFGTASSTTVGQQMTYAVPLVRTTAYPPLHPDGTYGINMIKVRFAIGQLFFQDGSGNVTFGTYSTLVEYKRTSSSTWLTLFGGPLTVTAKTTTGQVREYRWPVDPVNDTFDIRVTLLTNTSAGNTLSVSWESFQEIVGGIPTYDGTAVTHVVGQASDQFATIPDLWGVYDGLLCKIPSNYNPYTRVYTGTWDGTFVEDWTSNPAWCLYTLAMNSTWGAKAYWPNINLNKYDVYAAGIFCDALVPNGHGGFQPRYTCNGLISTPRGIREQLRYMAGIFNGTLIDDLNGNIRLVFDQETDAIAIFTQENVTSEFNYTYTDASTRYNEVVGRFNNPNLIYQTDSRTLDTLADIAINGKNSLTFDAIMCTDAHECVRRTAYKLLTSLNECEIISFSTNRQGLMIHAFSKILVSDPDMGRGLSGRILTIDSSRTVINLRDPLYLEAGVLYNFQTHMQDVSGLNSLKVVTIPFYAGYTGETLAIELSSALPTGVDRRAAFSLGSGSNTIGVPKAYRVTKVEEGDGNPDGITIEAVEIYSAKYVLCDNVADTLNLDYINMPLTITPPTTMAISTTIVQINADQRANVAITWTASTDPRASHTYGQYRLSGDIQWIQIFDSTNNRGDIYDIPNGTYDFRIASGPNMDNLSVWVATLGVLAGKTVPPDDVALVSASVQGTTIFLSWIPVFAKNLDYYWLRYSPLTDGTATWESSTDLIQKNGSTSCTVPATAGTYFVKAVNTSGIASVHAGSVTSLSSGLNLVAVDTVTESPGFAHAKTNCFALGGDLFLDKAHGNSGQYVFETTDLGAVYTSRVTLALTVSAAVLGHPIADWITLADVANMSGVDPSQYAFSILIAISTAAPILGISTYGPYTPFTTGSYTGRRFAFAIEMQSFQPNVVPIITALSSSVSMPSRTESGKNLLLATSGNTVAYANGFHNNPAINVSLKNPQTGDYVVISSDTQFGFNVQAFDHTNTGVGRFIDWIAVGYGGP